MDPRRPMQTRHALIACCFAISLTGEAHAQPFFVDVTKEMRLPSVDARGMAVGDFDNDGWLDLALSRNPHVGGGPMILLHNQQGRYFASRSNVIRYLEVSRPLGHTGGGVAFADYDNDGDLDLFVPAGWGTNVGALNALLRNDRGIFQEITLEAGLTAWLPTDNVIWFDYDRDGWLDLYIGNTGPRENIGNRLYRNLGNGRFEDRTVEAGLEVEISETNGGSNGGLVASDFNLDGWPDLYIGVYESPNRLFLNNGNGGFEDATTTTIGDVGQAYGVAAGDIDGDGDIDLFQSAGGGGSDNLSLLLLNVGGEFLNITTSAGLSQLTGSLTEPRLFDVDNDSDLDLVVSNPYAFFLNDGNGVFTDATARSGVEDLSSWSAATGDFDNDGSTDLYFGGWPDHPIRLFRNAGAVGHWLDVELVGTASNRSGIGSRVLAVSGDLRRVREIYGGSGLSQDPAIAHFGLDNEISVDTLVINWPSGQMDLLTDIPADQKIRVIEGAGNYHEVHPSLISASPGTLFVGGRAELTAVVRPSLFESTAQIISVTSDLSAFGGPDVTLEDRGDGSFTLQHVIPEVIGANGEGQISVMIDQSTSVGPYWTRLSQLIIVLPGRDFQILADGAVGGWRLEPVRGVTSVDRSFTSNVFEGDSATAVTVEFQRRQWQLDIVSTQAISSLGFSSLHLAIDPGTAKGGGLDLISLSVNGRSGVDLIEAGLLELAAGGWQESGDSTG